MADLVLGKGKYKGDPRSYYCARKQESTERMIEMCKRIHMLSREDFL